jgi:molybdopterin/thiamine biosynthesis adenylyltransferase
MTIGLPVGNGLPAQSQSHWTSRWRDEFCDTLIVAGFSAVTSAEIDQWIGTVEVSWADPNDGQRRFASHGITIELAEAFPFVPPVVRPSASEVIPGSPHLMRAGNGSALCLWVDGRDGWRPWTRAEQILDRVAEWFRHAHCDDWTAAQRPPDFHLFFPVSKGPRMMLTGEDWPPAGDATAGQFGLWRKNDDTLLAGSPTTAVTVRPSDEPAARERLSLTNWKASDVNGTGYWFRLIQQPRAADTLAELFDNVDDARQLSRGSTLQQLRATEADKVAKDRERLFFALGYPNGAGEDRWVFVGADRTPHRRNWRTTEALRGTCVFGMAAAPATREALLRRTGHTAAALEGVRVAIFGVGALGSVTALWLAKAGVPALTLIDSDRLRPGNAIRHAAGLMWVGREKTLATHLVIVDAVPDCRVASYPETWDRDYLRHIVEDATVIVDTTAVPAFTLLLNDVSLSLGKPLIAAAAFHRAQVGRVRIVRPGVDACMMCYEGGYMPHDARYPAMPIGDDGGFYETGCGEATVEATAVDADAVSNVLVRAVLRVVRDRRPQEAVVESRNHATIVNAALPGSSFPFDSEGIHWTRWQPRSDCVACGGGEIATAERPVMRTNTNEA